MHSEDVERGEVLVNERVLLSDETKPGQRRSLFHTRCKCEDKCCDVIIDGGSTYNLVFEEMVSKLKLKMEKHPQPYGIAWVKDDHKVLISEQCLVKFKIGSYHDEVLCDIFQWMYAIYCWEDHGSLIGMHYMMVMQIHTL